MLCNIFQTIQIIRADGGWLALVGVGAFIINGVTAVFLCLF